MVHSCAEKLDAYAGATSAEGLPFIIVRLAQINLIIFLHAGVVKWQTRGTQNPVGATPCRFDPDHRHQFNFKTLIFQRFLL